jgi:predicted dehydrogenase/threonine dehydrogenase-like Zn-dependent dehydrogenase
MKQILQNQKTGDLKVVEVPTPALQRGRVLVRTEASLISAGTERMSLELAQKTLVGKAIERPDLVKQVVQKFKTEGLVNTVNAVRARLDTTKALGYSASGSVIEVGSEVRDLRVGDRVACAGADFASHAEMLSVPQNLCVRLPDEVTFEAGAFGTLGAIALQGVRLAEPTLGEAAVVIGLGLLGQITIQLLKANGCRVCGIDLDPEKVKLASELGADASIVSGEQNVEEILNWSRGRGADLVVITAATSSNQPIELAAEVSRRKGRVVAVGLVGLDVPRQAFYERELTLKVSMSYGPGRYDLDYEERGHDYPFPYVRWTEQRNIEAFLDLVAAKRIEIERLITHRFSISDAERAYELISNVNGSYLGVLLTYDSQRSLSSRIELPRKVQPGRKHTMVKLGLIGAGKYVRSMLLPHFREAGVSFRSITTASGVSAQDVGQKFGFESAVSNTEEILGDNEINLVVIGTRHDSHADLAIRALENNRHVFVEKPLALNDEELDRIIATASNSDGQLMVGFNRRFSPLAQATKDFFNSRTDPLSILYRVNAGRIAREHWIQDSREGGGRLIGEVCHFIDLMTFFTNALPVSIFAEAAASHNDAIIDEDSVFITIRFSDGSNGCIAYLAEGDKALAKERVEIFGNQRSVVLDDFRSGAFYKNGKSETKRLRTQDKGQAAEVRAICDMVLHDKPAPIRLEELVATTRATFRALDSLRTGQRLTIGS